MKLIKYINRAILCVCCVVIVYVNVMWVSADSDIPDTHTEDEVLVASLPTYAQKFANSKEKVYTLSCISDVSNYINNPSMDKLSADYMELKDAVYFDNGYLAQYVSIDTKGVLNVFCEITTANNIYVYDLYNYKGKNSDYIPQNDIEEDLISLLKMRYMPTTDIDSDYKDIVDEDYTSVMDSNIQFDSIRVTDILWGKQALTDEKNNRVLIEFKATLNNKETNNYLLLYLNENDKIEKLLLL